MEPSAANHASETVANPEPVRAKWWKFTKRTLVHFLGIYAVTVLVLFMIQRWFIFPASPPIDRKPSDPPYNFEYEDVMLPVGKYLTNAWFIQAKNARGIILFSHGNAGSIAEWFDVAHIFSNLGFSTLLYDYGGYGRSTGKPSEQRLYEDIRAVWRYLTEQRKIPPEKIALVGRSIGGGPTVQLATEVIPGAVILESTFSSLPRVVQDKLFFFPVNLLVRDRFENDRKISQIHAPILIIHSVDDGLIHVRHARRLFNLANDPKTFLEISGEHNDGYFTSLDKYYRGLYDFLSPLFPEPKK